MDLFEGKQRKESMCKLMFNNCPKRLPPSKVENPGKDIDGTACPEGHKTVASVASQVSFINQCRQIDKDSKEAKCRDDYFC